MSTLRLYQKEACQFAIRHNYAYIAAEMGLGKSLISLAIINRLGIPTLVVAPKLVATVVWPEEIAKWLPELTYSVITGTAKQRDKAVQAKAQLHIINYENLAHLIANHKWQWPMVIFDEMSRMKSNGVRVKAFMKVRKHCQRIIALSGTPAVNTLMALFYQYKCLDGGETFGTSIARFRDRYYINKGYNFPDWHIRKGAEAQILSAVRPTMLTMRVRDYLDELPQVVTTRHYFELSPASREQYKAMRDDAVLSLNDKDIIAGSAAVKSGKLRQLAAGFAYDEDGVAHLTGGDKLESFKDLIESLGDEQMLIFYWFQQEEVMLRPFATQLDNHAIEAWNGGRLQRMMANSASASHGLNLQKSGAHHIIYVSLPWCGETYIQSIGRLLRSGNKAQTIFVHQLIAKDTIDEKVATTLTRKIEQHGRLMR